MAIPLGAGMMDVWKTTFTKSYVNPDIAATALWVVTQPVTSTEANYMTEADNKLYGPFNQHAFFNGSGVDVWLRFNMDASQTVYVPAGHTHPLEAKEGKFYKHLAVYCPNAVAAGLMVITISKMERRFS